MHHVGLGDRPRLRHRDGRLGKPERVRDAGILRRGADEGDSRILHRPAEGAEHRAGVDRLRCGDRGVRIAHLRAGDAAADDDHLRLHPEEGRIPEHKVGPLPHGDRPDMRRYAVGDGRVDGVFRDIALDPHIVVVAGFIGQPSALDLHLVRCLPGADDDLADTAHGLAVGRDDRKGPHVMKDVLCRDGFAPDPAFGKGHIFRY